MNIPSKYQQYFFSVEAQNNIELQDDRTRIIVRDEKNCLKIIVDKGIINDVSHGIKKSDFAIVEDSNGNFYLMELKGAVIDEALKQLLSTIEIIEGSGELQSLIKNRSKLIACIVSPNRQQIPKGGSSHERALAKKLYDKSRIRPQNMFDLIYYIKVVQRQEQATINKKTRQVICSNRNPLVLNRLG